MYNVVNSNGFDVSIQYITYVMGILCSPIVLMEPMNTLPHGQANIMFNNGCGVMLCQPLKQMVAPYL
jgi:hypothetical protein